MYSLMLSLVVSGGRLTKPNWFCLRVVYGMLSSPRYILKCILRPIFLDRGTESASTSSLRSFLKFRVAWYSLFYRSKQLILNYLVVMESMSVRESLKELSMDWGEYASNCLSLELYYLRDASKGLVSKSSSWGLSMFLKVGLTNLEKEKRDLVMRDRNIIQCNIIGIFVLNSDCKW